MHATPCKVPSHPRNIQTNARAVHFFLEAAGEHFAAAKVRTGDRAEVSFKCAVGMMGLACEAAEAVALLTGSDFSALPGQPVNSRFAVSGDVLALAA